MDDTATSLRETAPLYDPATFDPSTGVGRLMTRVKVAMMDRLDEEFAPFDITAAQYVVLVKLAAGETDSASALCRGGSYDPGAMTRMIDRLERKGLVRRARCGNDRRKVIVELTPEGRAVYPSLVQASTRTLNHFMRGFTRQEADQLEQYLRRMLANA